MNYTARTSCTGPRRLGPPVSDLRRAGCIVDTCWSSPLSLKHCRPRLLRSPHLPPAPQPPLRNGSAILPRLPHFCGCGVYRSVRCRLRHRRDLRPSLGARGASDAGDGVGGSRGGGALAPPSSPFGGTEIAATTSCAWLAAAATSARARPAAAHAYGGRFGPARGAPPPPSPRRRFRRGAPPAILSCRRRRERGGGCPPHGPAWYPLRGIATTTTFDRVRCPPRRPPRPAALCCGCGRDSGPPRGSAPCDRHWLRR